MIDLMACMEEIWRLENVPNVPGGDSRGLGKRYASEA